MATVSFSFLIGCSIALYAAYTIWTLVQIFIPPTCTNPKTCLTSYLVDNPELDLCIFMSEKQEIRRSEELKLLDKVLKFPYLKRWERKLILDIPNSVRQNGSLYLHLFAVPANWRKPNAKCTRIFDIPDISFFTIPITKLHVSSSYIFNLLEHPKDPNEEYKKLKKIQEPVEPVTHLKTKVTFNMLTEPLKIQREKVPVEFFHHLKLTNERKFLPVMMYNFLETRTDDLVLIENPVAEVLLRYSPMQFGRLCFLLHMREALEYVQSIGFSTRDIDDVKNIFAGTNIYLLSATILITSIHLLFDFLAFKNDVKFWRSKSTIEGLSFTSVLWRAFSQAVICLYLFDEGASLIVLGPSAVATFIEFWKVFKVTRRMYGNQTLKSEIETNKYDAECMKYLSYVLYPLCIGAAVYSLVYQPHKSWYSWCIRSLVNGVYAFGFLFMLPQLFINYRLKSVAALPLKAFMYKAFNTFTDDLFAFIITMPTAHRVACFRDDVIFLIYLYQRWLYPVDNSRKDEASEYVEGKETKEEDKKSK